MVRLLFGSHDTKHFHPKLMEFIRDREDTEAIELIRSTTEEYDPSRLTDKSGSTLLHHTAKVGSEAITAYLLSLGFSVNALDHDGKTPLVLAVLENRVTTTEILLNANSDIYVKADDDKSLVQSVFDGTIACYSHIIEMFVYKVISQFTDVDLQAKALIETKCPLYYVMNLRNPVITKIMLDHGCAIDARESRHGNSPLHKAVYFKDMENVKLLLAHGADVDTRDNGGKIAWRCAPNLDGSIVELKVLKLLLDRKPTLKGLTADGRIQMYELFVRGSEAAVRMILQSGIDFSGKDGKGDTVFHYLAMNHNLSGSKLLPDESYNVDSRNQGRLTALHVAAVNGNVGAMTFLLNSGAHVDAKTGDRGLTPLFCAVRAASSARKSKCVELLLERGADAQYVTSKKKTVFDVIRDSDDSTMKTLLAHLAMLESRGTTIIPLIRTKIDDCLQYKSQFDWFKQQLDEMKCDKIDESLTVFELLVEQKEDIEKYVRNEKLQLKLKSQNNNNYGFDPYYSSMLRRRVKRASRMVELF